VSALRTGTEAGSGTAGAVGAALAGTFGSLTLNADGSYTYVVDETNTAVQALRVTGQQLTDVFTYTMQDAGGLSDLAQLTLTIDGTIDGRNGTGNVLTPGQCGPPACGSAGWHDTERGRSYTYLVDETNTAVQACETCSRCRTQAACRLTRRAPWRRAARGRPAATGPATC
jgi:VCBS repeat-containing protein